MTLTDGFHLISYETFPVEYWLAFVWHGLHGNSCWLYLFFLFFLVYVFFFLIKLILFIYLFLGLGFGIGKRLLRSLYVLLSSMFRAQL